VLRACRTIGGRFPPGTSHDIRDTADSINSGREARHVAVGTCYAARADITALATSAVIA
jgi:hypothetical protein